MKRDALDTCRFVPVVKGIFHGIVIFGVILVLVLVLVFVLVFVLVVTAVVLADFVFVLLTWVLFLHSLAPILIASLVENP